MHALATEINPADLTDHTIVGDHGNLTQITGEVHESSVFGGMITAETEHGTLLLDADLPVRVLAPTRVSGPLTPERAHALADRDGFISVLITVPFDTLLGCDGAEGDELLDLISETTLDGGNLSNFTFTPVGVDHGSIVLHVVGSVADFLADADCWDACAEHAEDCDGYCDHGHDQGHPNACLDPQIMGNPAYPHGRCDACGWGKDHGGGCPNPDCDRDGDKIESDYDAGDSTGWDADTLIAHLRDPYSGHAFTEHDERALMDNLAADPNTTLLALLTTLHDGEHAIAEEHGLTHTHTTAGAK